jgi:NADH-quinone oxidoreductase subunit G
MSASHAPELVTVEINGIPVEVPKGELIVEAVKRIGTEVPIFCYHKRLKPVGMCRMCLVEVGFKQEDGSVRMMPKPQAACTLPADRNMVVYTDTESVQKDRRGVLEFLLVNHPLDCPICDRGGECPLQNNTQFYGPSTSRYVEIKRHLPKAFPLSKYVMLDLERCIQCGRCVRFTEEVSGDAQLAFLFRGAQMQPHTYELTEFTSRFSGNVIEICPVGALTSSQYRFRARPWDLETKPALCTECSNGCNVWFDYRSGRMVRINGRENEAVNEEWTCDRGKFGQTWLNSESRLEDVFVREGDALRPSTWAGAYETLLPHFRDGGERVAILAGPRTPNEGLFLFGKLFRETFRSPNLDHRWTQHLPAEKEGPEPEQNLREVNSTLQSLTEEPVIFVFGGNLAEEQPMYYLRTRKAWFLRRAKVVVLGFEPQEAESFSSVSARVSPDQAVEALTAILESVRNGSGGAYSEIADALRGGFALLASRSLYNLPDGARIVTLLGELCIATGSASKFNLLAQGANEQGARELGFFPSGGRNTRQILEGCCDGSIRALWLLDADPFELWQDRQLVERALESVEFLVVQSSLRGEAFDYASVVLPMTAFPEQDGTYVNAERRVQRIAQILPPRGHSKPAWRVGTEMLLRLEGIPPYFGVKDVLAEIARTVPAFEGVSWAGLDGEGILLSARRGSDETP